jgi:titin
VLTTFTVTNTLDSGLGSLRQAILGSNASGDSSNAIQFAIAGSGVHTINLLSSLPAITRPVLIDGYTQAGSSVNTLAVGDNAVLNVELSGAATVGANGLIIAASNTTVRGLVINRFNQTGIHVTGAAVSGDTVAGNFIGTNAAGTAAQGNGRGLTIGDASNTTTVGGTTAAARNLISGNRGAGIYISGSGVNGNMVAGNYIGTDVTGTAAIGNGGGVAIEDGSTNNLIGGTTAGARNLISGNLNGGGIYIYFFTSTNVVEGNYIGTDVTGTVALANGYVGIELDTGSTNNTIGGTTTGARDLISGNQGDGVFLVDPYNANNLVVGNYIGTDLTGTRSIANAGNGVHIAYGAANETIGGSSSAAARNLISGNGGNGIEITGTLGALGNVVAGNYIGTDFTGTAALANQQTGVLLNGGAAFNIIGGTTDIARNLISGNRGSAIVMDGLGTAVNFVDGNYIGTNAAGTAALANAVGVVLCGGASNNTIGGTTATARNVISGNQSDGIEISNPATTGNLVQDNYIGTDASGTSALGNGNYGVWVSDSPNNRIGGTSGAARNIVSANAHGIVFEGSAATGNLVQGNYIGTNATGTLPLGNRFHGVVFTEGPSDNVVGGTAPGALNLISGNGSQGIVISSILGGILLQGNYVGTDVTGTSALANGADGVIIFNSPNNTVGGTDPGARNVISGNQGAGVWILAEGATGNLVQGNYIGTTAIGAGALGNGADGVLLSGGSHDNTVGGTAAGAGNVIAGNAGSGIHLTGDGTAANLLLGNLIGTDATGMVALGNGGDGVTVSDNASNNTIGGTTAGAGNVIAGNGFHGISLYGSDTAGNLVQGNYIGTDASGTLNLGNGGNGVAVIGGAHDNAIGGMDDGAANLIAFNGNDGVLIDTGTGNAILGNSIFANGNLGIELLNGGNNGQASPELTSAVSGDGVTTVQGTFTGQASTTYTLEFFANSDDSAQGQQLLRRVTVTTDENGVATFSVDFDYELLPGQLVTATATDPADNTSAFSQAVAVTG